MTTPLIADATGFGHMDGFGWGMMGFGWLAMLVVIALVVWMVLQSTNRSESTTQAPTDSARRILAERYARGEIDDDEYRRRSAALDS